MLSENGLSWVGVDIAPAMLGQSALHRAALRCSGCTGCAGHALVSLLCLALTRAVFLSTHLFFFSAATGVAVKRDVEGDLLCADIGQGLFFRPNSFDGAIRSVQGAGAGAGAGHGGRGA